MDRADHRKAIALYERAREVEPENTQILRRPAAQRGRSGQREKARRAYRAAAEHLAAKGFVEQAIGVYRDFAQLPPPRGRRLEAISELELTRELRPGSVEALLEGRRFFRSRHTLWETLCLLRRA